MRSTAQIRNCNLQHCNTMVVSKHIFIPTKHVERSAHVMDASIDTHRDLAILKFVIREVL